MIVVSIDPSTICLAYAVWEDGDLLEIGKVFPSGNGDEGIASFTSKILVEFDKYAIDTVVYELPYLGINPKTAATLLKVVGAMIGGFYELNVFRFKSIPPITWQNGIGITKSSKKEFELIKKEYSNGRTISWLKAEFRRRRKQQIINFINDRYALSLNMKDNDIADAIGIGHFFWQHLDLEHTS